MLHHVTPRLRKELVPQKPAVLSAVPSTPLEGALLQRSHFIQARWCRQKSPLSENGDWRLFVWVGCIGGSQSTHVATSVSTRVSKDLA